MKDKILFKSNFLSINFFVFFLGFIFFSLITGYIYSTLEKNSDDGSKITVYILVSIFLIGALGSLYYFIKTEIVKVTQNNLIISYLFLPFPKKILIKDIKEIKQLMKPVKYSDGFGKPKTVYTIFQTSIILKNKREIKTYALNDSEFFEVKKLMEKIKRSQPTFDIHI